MVYSYIITFLKGAVVGLKISTNSRQVYYKKVSETKDGYPLEFTALKDWRLGDARFFYFLLLVALPPSSPGHQQFHENEQRNANHWGFGHQRGKHRSGLRQICQDLDRLTMFVWREQDVHNVINTGTRAEDLRSSFRAAGKRSKTRIGTVQFWDFLRTVERGNAAVLYFSWLTGHALCLFSHSCGEPSIN